MTIETANRLYELRKKHKLSQEELAEKLGVSRQAVSKWERSEASPDTDNLIALAKIYDLSLDELIFGQKEDNKEESAGEDTSKKVKSEEESTEEGDSSENVFIAVDDDENKVKIGHMGILVEKNDGKTVKINLSGITVNSDDEDDEDDEDADDDDDYKIVFMGKGDVGEDKHLHIKVKKRKGPKFWLAMPYPIICAIAYLCFGFFNVLGGWHPSWIIFVTVPVYYSLVEAIYKRSFSEFSYPVLTAVIYLVCGCYFGCWHPSWLVFVTVPIYYFIANALDKMIKGH